MFMITYLLKIFGVALCLHAMSNLTAAKVRNHFFLFPDNTHFHKFIQMFKTKKYKDVV